MHTVAALPHRPIQQAGSMAARLLLIACLCLGLQPTMPQAAFAEVTGTSSPPITIYYGTGESVAGEWREDILTIDGRPAYCVQVDSSFQSGLKVSSCDPVARGIWSQAICTKLALIDQFVKSGNYVSTKKGTGNGHRVTDATEQYAVAQCYIWKFLNDFGYSTNHHGWFGASTQGGIDLTGSDTDKQVWDYVRENEALWQGSAKYYDCGNAQDLACSFSLTPAKGYIALKKKSADEGLSSNSSYSLAGARYGIYSNESCSAQSLVETLTTNEKGEARSGALPAGSYFVKETWASAGFQVDPSTYPVTVAPGEEALVNEDAGCVFEQPATGSITLSKQSARPGISEGNGCYSLEGALYGIYEDEACKTLIAKGKTDAQGFLKLDKLAVGPCFVREISAPAGFAVNATTYRCVVEDGKITPVNGSFVEDLPKCVTPPILIKKHDAQLDPESDCAQGEAGLANAQFQVDFYAGSFATAEEAQASGLPVRSWVLKSDEDGSVPFDEAHLVSGDALYHASDGSPCIPLGTLVVRETLPPRGYLPCDQVRCVQLSDQASSGEVIEWEAPLAIGNEVKRGDLKFLKVTGPDEHALAGVPFAITSAATGETHVLVTNEKGIASTASGHIRHSVRTNGNDQLLDAKQAESSESPDDDEASLPDKPADQDEAGDTDKPQSEDGARDDSKTGKDGREVPPVLETPIDDDESFDTDDTPKQPGPDEKPTPLPESDVAPVTSPPISDDESFDTDDTMAASTGSSASDKEKTRSNTPATDDPQAKADSPGSGGMAPEPPNSKEGESMEENDRRNEANEAASPSGIWFGQVEGCQEGVPVDDERGALPYGTYQIEELPCAANEGLQLISASVIVSENGLTVDLGTIDDPKATITTSACDEADGDKTVATSKEAHVIDTVAFANLIPGRAYTLTGKLVDAATGEEATDAQGNALRAEVEFTPDEPTGTAQVLFSFPTRGIEGRQLVAFEALSCDDRVLALHENPTDSDQSVTIAQPSIATQASTHDGTRQVASKGGVIGITDTVSFTALIPGEPYAVTGTLMNALSGEEIEIDGKAVSASLEFVPEHSSGSVQLYFELDTDQVDDSAAIVVFEKLYANDELVASHEDPSDPAQTIQLLAPSIQTNLEAGQAQEGTSEDGMARLTDHVSYSNLTPGLEYTLTGTLIDKETGEQARDGNGTVLSAQSSFTPESAQGATQVDFEFDSSALEGRTLVAFERITQGERLIAEHADPDNLAQSTQIAHPRIQTYASDAQDHDQIVDEETSATILDAVSVTGAIPGRTYVLAGFLMDKATGLPFMQAHAEGSTDESEPEEGEGTTTAGESTIEEGESTTEGGASALWEELLGSMGLASRSDGRGLEISGAGEFRGDQVKEILAMHPGAGERIIFAQKEIAAESSSFEAEMEFPLSTLGSQGQIVVFEALVDKESGRVIAVHADLDDQAQTIEIASPAKEYPPSASKAPSTIAGSPYDKTGNLIARYAWMLALLGVAGCAAGAVAALRSRSRRRRRGMLL